MNRKVIYVSFVHLSDKTARDWYIDYLIEKDITVEYWDVVSLVREMYEEPAAKSADYLHTLTTYSQLETLLRMQENRDAYYVMLVSYEGRTVQLYRLLSKYNVRMLFIAWGALPIKPVQQWQKALTGITSPMRLAGKITNKLKAEAFMRLGLIKPFEIVFAAGQALISSNHFAKKVVAINLVDYDHYRAALLQTKQLIAGRYAVFLDINLPYQSDLKLVGMSAVNPEDYYASLNKYFEMVELKYGVKVVIAAHPKAAYSPDLFKRREIYYGQTPLLVKGADLVISHHSTSLSYAVLNSKPIVFIYTAEMAAVYKDTVVSYLLDFAEYLDAAIYNINAIICSDQIGPREVNTSRYDNYKYNFLTTHESENLKTQEIFWREVSMN